MRVSATALLLGVLMLAACAGGAAPTAPPAPEPTATPLPAPAQDASGNLRTFVVVPEQSQVSYLVDEEFFEDALAKLGIQAGLSDVVGSTQEIEGQLQLNLEDLSAPLGENRFTVQLNTLRTDQSRRDNWIRENGPRFNEFPLASFVATGIEDAPTSYTEGEEVQFKMAGDLTIRNVTQPVTFDVTAKLEGDTLSGVATTRLLMSDFGIEPPNFINTLTVADEFGLEIQITAQER